MIKMSEKTFELIFVRHAQSFGNVNDEAPPEFHPDDPPLTQLGLKQARALASRFGAGELSAIYSSTLIRTAQTVQPTAEKLGLKITMLPELMEVETTIAGTPPEIVEELAPNAVCCLSEPSPLGGGLLLGDESVEQLEKRGKKCVDYFKSIANDGDRILIASHACFFGYLIRPALGLSLPESFNFKVNNCGVTSILYRPGMPPLLEGLNDTAHFYELR